MFSWLPCLNKELESNDPVINYKVYELQIKNRLIPKSNASLNETVNLFSWKTRKKKNRFFFS